MKEIDRGDILVRMENSFEIKAPPEKVWEMLALDRQVEWLPRMESAKYTSEVHTPEDKFKVGASAHLAYADKSWDNDVEITESLKNEKMTYRASKPSYTVTYILKPVEGGTKLTFLGIYEMPGGILGKIFFKLAGGSFKKETWRSFEKLKSILEK